jgi:hypothetical protein
VGPSGVVEVDPLSVDAGSALLGFEAMTMHASLLQCSDHAFDHSVLLRAVWCDELLPQAVTAHEARIGPRGEHKAVVGPQQERRRDAPERPEPRDQRLLERRHRRRRPAASRELPAEQFARVTVDDKRQGLPTITTCPDAAQIRHPAFVRYGGYRRQRLDARAMPNGPLSYLLAHQLEYPLNVVLFEARKASDSSIAKRGFGLDHLLDRCGISILNLRFRFHRLVVDRTPRNLEPTTALRHRNGEAVLSQAPPDLKDHVSSLLAKQGVQFFRARSFNIASPYASCRALGCDSYRSRMSSGLVFRAFSIPALAWSLQDSISEGGRSNRLDDPVTLVFP